MVLALSIGAQIIGTLLGVGWALFGFVVYGAIRAVSPLRPTQEEAFTGADLSILRIGVTPEREALW